ncbi:MAG: hypothetical protein ACREV5_07565 [Steroidobacter sp.]
MERNAIEGIRQALSAARDVAQNSPLDGCDLDDIAGVIEPAEAELDAANPNVQTLSTYLNSLARSLRAEPGARAVCLRLDAAMREAGVPTNWEH